jgi:uncharacterized NAD(P)/FAD-binding protein YdhS
VSRLARIGIIGGGASAVCLLDALSQRDVVYDEVTVFEPSSYLWRGRAYQPDVAQLRLNAPPDDMSVRFGDVDHFRNWYEARTLTIGSDADEADHADRWSGTHFVPRALYGDYLEQAARAALMRLAGRGSRIRLVRQIVAAAVPTDDGLELRTADGARHGIDYAVLCVGGDRPADPYRLGGAPGFVADPYPAACPLVNIAPHEDVAILGSGLTAVDVALVLAARRHRGEIVLLSRRGVLPAVRQRPIDHELRHFTAARFRAMAAQRRTLMLDDTLTVMRAEFADAGVDQPRVTRELTTAAHEDPLARLRRHLAAVDDRDLGLRILQRAVPDTGPDVWPLLPDHEQEALVRDHYRTMMSLCCPMPPASAATLLALADGGRARVVSQVENVVPMPGGGFLVESAGDSWKVGTVVSAVGAPTHRIPRQAAPLVATLADAGLADPHPRGGVLVERATSRLTVDGVPSPRLYALGDLAAGSLFFTFGVTSLVDRAQDITDAILSHAVAGRPCAMQTA